MVTLKWPHKSHTRSNALVLPVSWIWRTFFVIGTYGPQPTVWPLQAIFTFMTLKVTQGQRSLRLLNPWYKLLLVSLSISKLFVYLSRFRCYGSRTMHLSLYGTLVAQLCDLQNWGEGYFKTFGEVERDEQKSNWQLDCDVRTCHQRG